MTQSLSINIQAKRDILWVLLVEGYGEDNKKDYICVFS